MNILLINHYAGSPLHGMEFRPFYLAREWVRMGHTVQIVGASFSHIRANQPVCDGESCDEQVEGVSYRWYRTPRYSGNGIGRVRNMLSFIYSLWRDALRIADQIRPDVVIASSTYPMDIWPARRIAQFADAKLVFEVHDLWPLSPIALGGMSKWHPFILWVQSAEDFAYRHANKVISMLPNAEQHMNSRGLDPEKFAYVPNGVDVCDWENPEALPSDILAHVAGLKGSGLPLIGYAGTYGLANALDVLLDAAAILEGKAQFVLVGKGPEEGRLARRVADEKICNVSILPPIPKRAIPSFLEQLDIAYIGWRHNPLYRFGISPNKLMDYMMAGKPIVHSVCAGNDPVEEAGCGITIPPDDAEAVASAVLKLAEMPKNCREALGSGGRNFILKNQTYGILAKRFLQSVESRYDR